MAKKYSRVTFFFWRFLLRATLAVAASFVPNAVQRPRPCTRLELMEQKLPGLTPKIKMCRDNLIHLPIRLVMTMWAMGWFSANIRRDTERRRRHFWTEKVNQEVNEGIPPAAISDSVAFLAVQVEPVVHFVHHLVVVSIFHWHFRPRWSWLQAKEPNRTASGVEEETQWQWTEIHQQQHFLVYQRQLVPTSRHCRFSLRDFGFFFFWKHFELFFGENQD